MLLVTLSENYVPEDNRIVTPSTEGYLRSCAQSYSAFLNKNATTVDLTEKNANNYVRWMANNRAASTVRSKRSGLMMLWKCAHRIGESGPPGRILLPRLKKPIVRAWTLGEVRVLVDHCMTLEGVLKNGIPTGVFFASLLSSGYETGLRLSDQLSIERSWLLGSSSGESRITIVEEKTGKECRRIISKESMVLIDECMSYNPDRALIWPLTCRRETFYEHVRKIVKGSGIRKGTFKYLRRTAGTQAEIMQPGGGQAFLNHSSPQVTRDSYLDQWQITPEPIRVPLF